MCVGERERKTSQTIRDELLCVLSSDVGMLFLGSDELFIQDVSSLASLQRLAVSFSSDVSRE